MKRTFVLLGIGALLQLVLLASVYYLIRHDITERRLVAAELHRREILVTTGEPDIDRGIALSTVGLFATLAGTDADAGAGPRPAPTPPRRRRRRHQ